MDNIGKLHEAGVLAQSAGHEALAACEALRKRHTVAPGEVIDTVKTKLRVALAWLDSINNR
jgi:hypothetical protein